MSAGRIKEAAIVHFARNGYDGASLSQIAGDVGIRTPSIYAHFKSKEELFLSIILDVQGQELAHIANYFDRTANEPMERRLKGLIAHCRERFETNGAMKFWMRMMFFPPVSLEKQVLESMYAYLDNLEVALIRVFQADDLSGRMTDEEAERAAAAFLCLLDGVLVELLYGGADRYEKRLQASWAIYWQGIRK